MIEKLVTSRMRAKLLKLFLSDIDKRYYLRELERILNESLSPLRRQLIKLVKMGILIIEYEGNIKYYRLNKGFEGVEELRRLVLGREIMPLEEAKGRLEHIERIAEPLPQPMVRPKRIRYEVITLTIVSLLVVIIATFVIYTNVRDIKQVANLVLEKAETGKNRLPTSAFSKATRPDEMISRKWKLLPGSVPALSSGETGGERKTEEL